MRLLMNILSAITSLYMFLIFIRIMLTWFSGANYGRPYEILSGVTDPYLNWFRRFSVLRVASMDLSPIAALAVLSVVNNIFTTLARFGRISLGIILALCLSALWSALSFILGFFILVVILRLIAYLSNRNTYGGFWRIVDILSQPVLYRIGRIIFQDRLVHYLTRIITSVAALLILRIGLGILMRLVMNLLIRLPI
ncbi:MAG: YggT family protein [Spirochaetaceae bacterium]|jgi:YggT family protein|nr:YggT family protein [Spirochaetaceae bacterium]